MGDADDMRELNFLLNDTNESGVAIDESSGSNLPCFEIWFKSGKSKVRIFSAAQRHIKLQMTKNTSEVFGAKMQSFVARKNKHIVGLTD